MINGRVVYLRADANSTIGMGHFVRIYSLAKMLQDTYHCVFVMESPSVSIVEQVEIAGFEIISISEGVENETVFLSQNITSQSIVVIDGYKFNEGYFKSLHDLGAKVVLIDDLGTTSEYLSMIFNHCIGKKGGSKSVETKLCYGVDYAILRPSFLAMAKRQNSKPKMSKVFVCYGGADQANLTLKVLEALDGLDTSLEVNVVLAGSFPFQESILDFQRKSKQNVVVHQDLHEENMASLMQECAVAFAPTSNLSYELCCARTVLLGGYFIDNQKEIHDGLLEHRCIVSLGNLLEVSKEQIQQLALEVIVDANLICNVIDAQSKYFDGASAARISATFQQFSSKSETTTKSLNEPKKHQFELGILASGVLGLEVIKSIYKRQTISFIATDSGSNEVIEFAIKNEIPIFTGNPRSGKLMKFINELAISLDLIFSVSYLFLIEKDVISTSKVVLNIHGSLLPLYRGRTPHVWAIINGETETGVSVHLIDEGCDTGAVLMQKKVLIAPADKGSEVMEQFKALYPDMVLKSIDLIRTGKAKFKEQDEIKSSFYGKRNPEDGQINWSWNTNRICNWVRAMAEPYPGAIGFLRGEKVIINQVMRSDLPHDSSEINGMIVEDDPTLIVKVGDGLLELLQYKKSWSRCVKGEIFESVKMEHSLKLQEVTLSDELLAYNWANDWVNRKFSQSNTPLSKEEHKVWFCNKISDINCLYYLVKLAHKSVGYIRFDLSGETAEISYLVDKNHRRKGLGKQIIQIGMDKVKAIYEIKNIQGVVMKNNTFSIQIFKKFGFEQIEHSRDCFMYVKKINE
jgi:methionyl-tRNA formyltransferase